MGKYLYTTERYEEAGATAQGCAGDCETNGWSWVIGPKQHLNTLTPGMQSDPFTDVQMNFIGRSFMSETDRGTGAPTKANAPGWP